MPVETPLRADAAQPPPLPAPENFRRYRLIAELGQGGMADVFLAASPDRQVVVIKQLRTGSDNHLVTMFLDEVKLAARLQHPNIVKTFEVVQQGPRTFMVMEYLDGPSLSRLRRAAMKNGKRLPLWYELKIIREALRGLHAAHELRNDQGALLNVVHRDFTPQNVMTTFAGDVKIVDFGVAKVLDQQSQTTAGMFKGKLSYSPPEQLLGQQIDRRADVFAAGVLLFEAVTGDSPWAGKTNGAITHALSSGNIPRLIERPDAPPELAAIVDQAMAVDPDDRYPTAEALREALDAFVKEQEYEVEQADLSTFVSAQLADTRERTRVTVESRLKILETLPSADTLAGTLPSLEGGAPPEAKVVGRSLPHLMTSEAPPDTGQSWRLVEPPTKVKRRRHVTTLLVGAVVVMAVALVTVLFRQNQAAAPASPPAPVAVTPAPVGAAPVVPPPVVAAPVVPPPVIAAPVEPPVLPTPANVTVRVSAMPSNARLYLDDLELPTNPFQGEFPKDDTLHRLVVKAPGHLELKKGLQFDSDVSVDVALQRALVVGQKPTVVKTGTAPATDATDETEYFKPKPGKKAPKRQLDTDIDFQ